MSEKENSPKLQYTKNDIIKKIKIRAKTDPTAINSKNLEDAANKFGSLFKEWEKSHGKEEISTPSQEQDTRDDDR